MLLRLLRGRIAATELEGVQARLRSRIDRDRVGARGLFGVRTGYCVEGETAELIVASIWALMSSPPSLLDVICLRIHMLHQLQLQKSFAAPIRLASGSVVLKHTIYIVLLCTASLGV